MLSATFKFQKMSRIVLSTFAIIGIISVAFSQNTTNKIIVEFNIPFAPGSGKAHQLDVYKPADAKNCPILLFIHGGDRGDKSYETLGNAFSKNGIITLVSNYRLVPEFSYPSQVEDVIQALAWAKKNALKIGGNAEKIFLSGHSSGAVLVAQAALMPELLKKYQLNPSDVAGFIPISGLYDLRGKDQWLLDWFGKDEEQRKSVSPQNLVQNNTAPFLVMVADKDFNEAIQSSEAFSKALTNNRNKSFFCKIAKRDHGSIIRELSKGEDETFQFMVEFIKNEKHIAKLNNQLFHYNNRAIITLIENEREFIRFSEGQGIGTAWLNDKTFSEGIIEFDVRGRDELQKSFVGIAFHGTDEKHYEAVYFRPFNFNVADEVRSVHAIQYCYEPNFGFDTLRKTRYDEFEAAIGVANISKTDWFHAKIEVDNGRIKVFVNNQDKASLDVPTLNTSTKTGKIGFWVGNNSNGDFTNLKISHSTIKTKR
jgi:acetyl esterase/lipase